MARRSLLPLDAVDWDPMSADYYDPSFNSYTQGPGSRLDRQLQPCHPRLERENTVFKLHIRNIPATVSETGVRNIFLNYGDPVEVYRNPNVNGLGWAFVSFASHREAELAIRELNNTPPFYFKVQFARSPAEKERLRKEREKDELLSRVLESEPYPLYPERIPFLPFNKGIGRGRGVPLPRHMMVGGLHPGKFEPLIFNNNVVDDKDEDMGYYTHYVPGPYDDMDRILLQGMNMAYNSSCGKRQVSHGRGYYPISERPSVGRQLIEIKRFTKEEKQEISASLETLYESNDWFEFGEDMVEPGKSGNCISCDTKTYQFCQRCDAWYCSRECQVKDWPSHKTNCMPPLSSAIKSPSTSQQNNTSENSSLLRQKCDQRHVQIDNGKNNKNFSNVDGRQQMTNSRHIVEEEKQNISDVNNEYKPNFGREGQNRPNYKTDHHRQNDLHRMNKSRNDQFGDDRKGDGNGTYVDASKHSILNPDGTFKNSDDTEKRISVNDRLHMKRESGRGTLNSTSGSESLLQIQGFGAFSVGFGAIKKKPISKVGSPAAKFSEINDNKKCETSEISESSAVRTGAVRASIIEDNMKCEMLPDDTFSKVKVTEAIGPKECWVQLVSSQQRFLDIMTVLLNTSDSSPLCKPRVGVLCASLYEGLWYRGKVLSVEPEVRVLYIDFGNVEVCVSDQLKSLPQSLMDIPALALKIKLAEGTSEKYSLVPESVISVKPVGKTVDAATVVHVEGESYRKPVSSPVSHTPIELVSNKGAIPDEMSSNVSLKKTPEKYTPLPRPKHKIESVSAQGHQLLSSAVEGLKVGMKGACLIKRPVKTGDYGLSIVYSELKDEFTKILVDLPSICNSDSASLNYIPEVGEMVVAIDPEQNIWSRAYILSKGPESYSASFCDAGHVSNVSKVRKLPQEFASIPEFGARCSVISYTKPKEKLLSQGGSRCSFSVIDVDEVQKSVTCILETETNEELCKVILKHWVPSVEDEGLKIINMENNEMVVLSVIFNQKLLYVRPASTEMKDKFIKIQQDVGLHCVGAPALDHVPNVNDVVACKFAVDGNYYRAKVLEVEKEMIKLSYLDFGNVEGVAKDRLKSLPDDLKRIPCMAVRISLKDALDKPITKEASEFMLRLVGEEVILKMVKSGSYKDGVELFLPDGSSLNDKVNALLEPSWKKALSSNKNPTDGEVFFEDNLKFLELPLGKTVDFVVLHKLDDVTFMGCEAAGKIMAYVHTTMTAELNSYCESAPEKSYAPRPSELCLARYEDGVWYRAMCIDQDSGRENNIVFLDFGNMAHVEKTNIRKMVKDYVQTPVVALMCSWEGFEHATESQRKRIGELVQVNKIYKTEVVSCSNAGSYSIKFPHVIETLIKEKLLPTNQ